MPARIRLLVTSQATTPVAPPLASEPRPRPKMRRVTPASTGKRDEGEDQQLDRLQVQARTGLAPAALRAGAGRASPLMRAINWSIAASRPPA